MKNHIERLRGMHDLLPQAYQDTRRVMDRLSAFLSRAGYDQVDTPVLEQSDFFLASFGQELWQNLYTFRLHARNLCLRPEYTASICRLYLDHYQHSPLPLRFQYAGPVFRYEAPGRGRYRQHTQLGVELLGSTRDIPACGFAFGVERLLALLPEDDLHPIGQAQALVIPVSEQDTRYALEVARSVRAAGARIEVDVSGRSVSGGLRQANRKHIPFALIVGDEEARANTITLRNMATGEERVMDVQSVERYFTGEEQSS